jgi:hypothetical protein
VRTRYGLELDQGWLHDLIKDGLVPGAAREGNSGLRPIYTYGYRSYRRALQIARFRLDGVVERDAIRIWLFVKGYGETKEIRQALWNYYAKHGRAVIAPIRSGYPDNSKPIPDGHKLSLMKRVGRLDTRFDKAGLRLPDDRYIEGLRLLKNAADEPKRLDTKQILRILTSGPVTIEVLADLFLDLFRGFLLFSTREDRQAAGPDYIEQLILGAEDWQYEQAGTFCRLFCYVDFTAQLFRSVGVGADGLTMREVFDAIWRAIKSQPWCTALILVLGLLGTHSVDARFSEDMAVTAMHRIKKEKNFNFREALGGRNSNLSGLQEKV